MRKMRQSDRTVASIGTDMRHGLDDLEKEILSYMGSKTTVTRAELCDITGKSNGTVTGRLNNLMNKELVKRNGNKYDPTHSYSLIV